MAALVPPIECATSEDRTAFFYRAQELLRLEHNKIGKDFREKKITAKEWQAYLRDVFEPTSDEIVGGILTARQMLKTSTRWDNDISNR